MKRSLPLAALVFVALMFAALPSKEDVEHPKPTYVGADRCKVCHYEIFKSWAETRHARALSVLTGENPSNPACLRCHTTGYGTGGYGDQGVHTDLGGVQCEVCHGPGSLYSVASVMRDRRQSVQLGLTAVDSTSCTACHNQESPTFKGFAYRGGLRSGTHLHQPGKGGTTTP